MRFALVLAASVLALSVSVRAEVTESSPGHFVTRDSAVVAASPKAAWLALITPGDWWDDAHTWSGKAANLSITPQGGGCFCERIPEKDSAASVGLAGSAQHMTVVMAQPMAVLRMRGALGPLQSEPVDGVLTISLQPDRASGGTKIVWEYVVAGHMRFETATISKAVDGVMSQQLSRFAETLGRVAGPAAKPVAPATEPRVDRPASAGPAVAPRNDGDVGEALDAMDNAPGAPDSTGR